MLNKIYEKSKKYIKENYKRLAILLVAFLVCTYRLPFYINTTGGTINVDKRISIDGEYHKSGSFNLAYVSELTATIPTYLLSYVINDWEIIDASEYKIDTNDSIEDIAYRNRLYLDEANQNAIKVAYTKANKKFEVIDTKFQILYIDKIAETTFKVGDIILEAEGVKITSLDDYKQVTNTKEVGDFINLKVKRDGKKIDAKAKVQLTNNEKLTGIYIIKIYDYETEPDIDIKFKHNESGPSGGFMMALAIYNKLIKKDLTHGLKIVGTGTIDEDGNVGPIGGVVYKLKGAVKSKADIFFVPEGENYSDALKYKNQKGYKIKVIPIKNFDEAIEFLENY